MKSIKKAAALGTASVLHPRPAGSWAVPTGSSALLTTPPPTAPRGFQTGNHQHRAVDRVPPFPRWGNRGCVLSLVMVALVSCCSVGLSGTTLRLAGVSSRGRLSCAFPGLVFQICSERGVGCQVPAHPLHSRIPFEQREQVSDSDPQTPGGVRDGVLTSVSAHD